MSARIPLTALAALTLAAAGLPAQAVHEHGGHREALGRVTFPTSCRAEAQRRFERGVALLHSFWYERASETFKDVIAADSTCAMGYWGQAMILFHPLWTPPSSDELRAGLGAAVRGYAVARTPRERAYLAAVRAYYEAYTTVDPKTRLVAYAQAMEEVERQHPRDSEASIFYALSLIALGQANPTDTTFTYQRRADSILEPLFRREPRHPGLAHYLIHTNDVPQLAPLGLYAARRYAEIAPDVPHAQHMPSHIFTRLGLWDDAIASNQRSAAAARQFEEERHLNALWDQRGHAWDYMVYAYLQQGRDGEAKRVVDEAANVTAGYPAGSLVNAYALAAIPARYALERGAWGGRPRGWDSKASRNSRRGASRAGAAGRLAARARPPRRGGPGVRGVARAAAQPRPQPVRRGTRRGAGGGRRDGASAISGLPDAAAEGRRHPAGAGDRAWGAVAPLGAPALASVPQDALWPCRDS